MAKYERLHQYNNWVSTTLVEQDRLGDLLSELAPSFQIQHDQPVSKGPCPFHAGGPTDFGIRTNGHSVPVLWWCSRGCQKSRSGNLLGLVRYLLALRHKRPVGVLEAVEHVQDFLGVSIFQARTRSEVRQRLQIPSAYMIERSFSPAVLESLDVGHYWAIGRTVVPVYEDDLIVGFISRSELPHCQKCGRCHTGDDCQFGQLRWQVNEGFPKLSTVYNLTAAARSHHPFLILTEGVGDVLKVLEAGFPAVAGFGSELHDDQADKLAATGKKVLVIFDNDTAGRNNAPEAAQRLQDRGVRVRVQFPPEGRKDLGETTAEEIRQWLSRK